MGWRSARQANWGESWWPPIHNFDTAKAAARNGSYFAFLIAGLTAGMALLSITHIVPLADPSSLTDAVVFCALGIFVRRMSRVAATLALALFLLERAYETYARGWPTTLGLVITAFITVGFISGVRGTIAFHRYKGLSAAPKAASV